MDIQEIVDQLLELNQEKKAIENRIKILKDEYTKTVGLTNLAKGDSVVTKGSNGGTVSLSKVGCTRVVETVEQKMDVFHLLEQEREGLAFEMMKFNITDLEKVLLPPQLNEICTFQERDRTVTIR